MAYVGLNPKFNGVAVSKSDSGASVAVTVANTSNTASSKAVVSTTVAGGSADDAVFQAAVSGVTTWSFGVDNSDSDKFAVAASATLGTSNALTLDTSGNAVVTGTMTAASYTNKLSAFAATTSAELAGVISDETGSGALVFANTPTLVTPVLGVASATTINKVTFTAPATGATLTLVDGTTVTGPATTDTLVGRDTTDTLTNKTLTSPKLNENVAVTTTATKLNYLTSATGTTGTTSTNIVFSTSPTLVTPTLGAATATSINKVAITAPATSATLTLTDGTTVTGPAASGTIMTLGNAESVTGAKTFSDGKIILSGATSGTSTLKAAAIAGTTTITLPGSTDTLVGLATTDTLTNKTLTSPKINENVALTTTATKLNYLTSAGGTTGTTSTNIVFSTSPTLTTPNIGAATGTTLSLSTAASANVVAVTTTNADTNCSIAFTNDARTYTWSLRGDTSDAFELVDSTAGATRLRFSNAGVCTITNLGSGTVTATSGVLSVTSDSRLKTGIDQAQHGLAAIQAIEPKFYQWNWQRETLGDNAPVQYGFFAQQVGSVIPEALGEPGPDGFYGLHDRPIIAALVNAVKELATRVAELEAAS